MDIADFDAAVQTIEHINPDCVIHLAAISNPDECEKDPITGYKANALGTRNLALACQRFDNELVYISTDQVFNGKKKSPYTELDEPEPVNHYGKSKR
jgi:dTDP-4-dehydrorhamnose reductase